MKRLFRNNDSFDLAIVVSIVLHLLFLSLYGNVRKVRLFKHDASPEVVAEEEEKRLEFELVETPEDARSEKTPDQTNLLSDKTSVARDRYTEQDKPAGDPYSEGQTKYRTFAGALVPPTLPGQAEASTQAGEQGRESTQDRAESDVEGQEALPPSLRNAPGQHFSRNVLLKGAESRQENHAPHALDDATYKNLEFSAEDLGGVTLNTYAWDFAPYLLDMKRKLRQNIYPPAAFTRLGVISGETVLRFKVLPSGEMRDFEVLSYTGHPSLKETSVNAVRNSAPFKPLPQDFPENYLELTWTFTYSILPR